jgi:hypothetical protein
MILARIRMIEVEWGAGKATARRIFAAISPTLSSLSDGSLACLRTIAKGYGICLKQPD